MSNLTGLSLDPDRYTSGDTGYAHFGAVEVEMGTRRIYIPESDLTDIHAAGKLAIDVERAIAWVKRETAKIGAHQ